MRNIKNYGLEQASLVLVQQEMSVKILEKRETVFSRNDNFDNTESY